MENEYIGFGDNVKSQKCLSCGNKFTEQVHNDCPKCFSHNIQKM